MGNNNPLGRFSRIFVLAAGLALVFLPVPGMAGQTRGSNEAKKKDTAGTITVFFENDTFFDTDYLYTNGVKVTWISPGQDRWKNFGWIPEWGLSAMDMIPNLGAGLGNALVNAHGGIQVRLGWNLPDDFGTNLIRPGSDTNAPAVDGTSELRHRFGIHAFAGADARWVIHGPCHNI